MIVLAIDPSLVESGYAVGPVHDRDGSSARIIDGRLDVPNPCAYGTLKPPKGRERGVPRVLWIRDEILRLCDMHRARLVVLEGASFGSRGSSFIDLAELRGVLRIAIYESVIPLVEVPPSSLTKYATGKGSGMKDRVLAEAIRRLGYAGHNHNEADALWLWQMAATAYGLPGAVPVPKQHTETKKPVNWPIVE